MQGIQLGRELFRCQGLARIQFELGHLERAIELQERAVGQLGEARDRAAQAARDQLEKYEKALPTASSPSP